ncbi:Vacuolar protein sorting-associated protein 30 [Penicillium canariense]|uniref:Vacuolar protein sorting-associated protein 30 n=1 Tax=Penicillium canariense TaxID=189055 RepID=A0A9W9HZC6_9EURO|nr:Vacuolar protein sorting-associated protein 30 [Penicillium canariense]KAJ5157819.1 Vacuolar protein sorting-associated protein 30 [Penicillium canariense]
MYCQKCRTPLKLDGSLESLNPAAFELLASKLPPDPRSHMLISNQAFGSGSTGKTLSDHGATSSPRASYPADRREHYDRASSNATTPIYRRSIPAPRSGGQSHPPGMPRADSGNMSFVMLTESQFVPPPVENALPARPKRKSIQGPDCHQEGGSFANQIEKSTRLFEIVSSRSDIDHPVCVECTELLVEGLQKRLAGSTKERDAYISFLRNLNASVPTAEEMAAAEKSLQESLKAEETMLADLEALEREKAKLDAEIGALEEESQQLDANEEAFWRARNGFALTLGEFQTERDALNMRYDHDSQQLERLQRTNVYNDAFCIGHDGYFGTINGLRLGRLANPSVEWPEINAAWGQTCLLLATIAERLGFQFQGYRLRPLGSTSRIDKIEYPLQPAGTDVSERGAPKVTQLDLFSSGDLPLNLPWLHRRFDNGMVAFLDSLRQLGQFVASTPAPVASTRRGQTGGAAAPGLRLPYEIKKDRIGDASIKLGFNQNDETWTRACKYTLTCCKFLLAHASNVASAGSSNSAAVAAAAVAAASPTKPRT